MNQKYLGIVLIVLAVLVASITFAAKAREDAAIEHIIKAQEGTCYLPDGTCLHEDRNWTPFIIGWIIAGALGILGVYLLLIDKTQETLLRHQKDVSHALAEAKKTEKENAKFAAFLSAFTPEEQAVLKAIAAQDGIKQATLRYKTGISKTGLSLMLTNFEKKGLISRVKAGKTNQVFLRKKF